MDDYNNIKPNSHRYRAQIEAEQPIVSEKSKLEPVISAGKARTKKQNGLTTFGRAIISEDAQNVKSYILMDVLIPSFKKAISDIVTNGIDIILYGETGHTQKKNGAAGRVSYRNYYDGNNDRFKNGSTNTRTPSSNRTSVALFEDITVDTRGEADDILQRMSEYLEQYPMISVADMYDLANIKNFPYTYNNYGWTSIASAKPVRVIDGYLLKMPPIESLK